jgi:hypothetical protein
MIATRRVYPIGYSALGAQERIDALLQEPKTLLIDTRIKPWSWNEIWRKEELEQKYGEKYRWAGRYLGNLGKDDGYIEIADPIVGIKGLIKYLSDGYELILLCKCREYKNCHRSEIVRLLTKQCHVDVIHWKPAEQEVASVTKSGQQAAEIVEASADVPGGIQDTIPCLSIRQPWAWLIANGFKNIENRDWTTGYRGPLLIHAGKAVDNDCFTGKEINFDFFEQFGDEVVDALPRYKKDYDLGCIVGQANLVDVVTDSDSQWVCGKYGFILENALSINPIPYPGKLKLFDVPKDMISNQSAEQETVLAAETDELLIETADRPGDDPSATTGHCIVCSKTATLKSPSGRPEGIYCEQHGYCPRCKSSIEEFVKYPYGGFYVCPCAVGTVTRIEQKQELKQAKPVTFGF